MGDTNSEKPARELSREQLFQQQMEQILIKLKHNPSSITTEDARRLSENVEARDEKSARIISAVEAFAVANEELNEENPSLGQAPHTSLLTLVKDLHAAVDANPNDTTAEVLRTTQSIVSKMQKAVGQTNAPHPEVEAELQEEIAKIEPKIAEGTVSKAEADRLHSLEARAHGHTEKGGITAIAQSVVAKRERQLSQSSGSSPNSGRSRTNSKSFPTSQEQSHQDKENNLHKAEATIKPKVDQGTVTQADADVLHSREMRAHGHTEKGGLAATAQSLASQKGQDSPSDRSNVSSRPSETDYERRKEQSHNDKELNLKIAEMSIKPKVKEEPENVTQDDAAYLQSREHRAHGHVDKDGLASEAMSKAHRRQGSQTVVEAN